MIQIPIMTAHQCPSYLAMGGYKAFVVAEIGARWGLRDVRPDWNTRGMIPAYLARSVWRADCPYCLGSLWAAPDLPFFCLNCLMVSNDGHAMMVIFPDDRAMIEQVLAVRPVPDNRNWMSAGGYRNFTGPDETVLDLARENIEHGLPVPEVIA